MGALNTFLHKKTTKFHLLSAFGGYFDEGDVMLFTHLTVFTKLTSQVKMFFLGSLFSSPHRLLSMIVSMWKENSEHVKNRSTCLCELRLIQQLLDLFLAVCLSWMLMRPFFLGHRVSGCTAHVVNKLDFFFFLIERRLPSLNNLHHLYVRDVSVTSASGGGQ